MLGSSLGSDAHGDTSQNADRGAEQSAKQRDADGTAPNSNTTAGHNRQTEAKTHPGLNVSLN